MQSTDSQPQSIFQERSSQVSPNGLMHVDFLIPLEFSGINELTQNESNKYCPVCFGNIPPCLRLTPSNTSNWVPRPADRGMGKKIRHNCPINFILNFRVKYYSFFFFFVIFLCFLGRLLHLTLRLIKRRK